MILIFSINVSVKRLGGAYGAKISRTGQIACACAVVCHKLNRPARFIMTIESNMQTVGKRIKTHHEYEAGINDEGIIQYLDSKFWCNTGCNFNEPHAWVIMHHFVKYVVKIIANNIKCCVFSKILSSNFNSLVRL